MTDFALKTYSSSLREIIQALPLLLYGVWTMLLDTLNPFCLCCLCRPVCLLRRWKTFRMICCLLMLKRLKSQFCLSCRWYCRCPSNWSSSVLRCTVLTNWYDRSNFSNANELHGLVNTAWLDAGFFFRGSATLPLCHLFQTRPFFLNDITSGWK